MTAETLAFTIPEGVPDAIARRVVQLLQQNAEENSQTGGVGDAWLGVQDAAKYLACPASRIYDLVSLGRLNPTVTAAASDSAGRISMPCSPNEPWRLFILRGDFDLREHSFQLGEGGAYAVQVSGEHRPADVAVSSFDAREVWLVADIWLSTSNPIIETNAIYRQELVGCPSRQAGVRIRACRILMGRRGGLWGCACVSGCLVDRDCCGVIDRPGCLGVVAQASDVWL